MPVLSDTQTILLSTAAQRDDRNLYPLPASLKPGGGLAKATAALGKAGFAEQREVSASTPCSRSDGDVCVSLFATAAGLAAIGIEPEQPTELAPCPMPAAKASTPTKIVQVLALLRRDGGATIAELIAVTGWLPHTTRAALTRLRQQGYVLAKSKRNDVTTYAIVEAA